MDRRISFSDLLGLVILVACIYIGYDQYKQYEAEKALDAAMVTVTLKRIGTSDRTIKTMLDNGLTMSQINGTSNGR